MAIFTTLFDVAKPFILEVENKKVVSKLPNVAYIDVESHNVDSSWSML